MARQRYRERRSERTVHGNELARSQMPECWQSGAGSLVLVQVLVIAVRRPTVISQSRIPINGRLASLAIFKQFIRSTLLVFFKNKMPFN